MAKSNLSRSCSLEGYSGRSNWLKLQQWGKKNRDGKLVHGWPGPSTDLTKEDKKAWECLLVLDSMMTIQTTRKSVGHKNPHYVQYS